MTVACRKLCDEELNKLHFSITVIIIIIIIIKNK
jgi:hypothetical protein